MEKQNREKLSLVIPCFNEVQSVPIFYEETTKYKMRTMTVLKQGGWTGKASRQYARGLALP